MDRVIRGQRVVTPDGILPASIHVDRGRIARVAAFDDVPVDVETVDAGNNIVMPGVIDTHVHVNEPTHGVGRVRLCDTRGGCGWSDDDSRHAAQFDSADDDRRGLEAKRNAARGKLS